jgi:hypothetical protein
MDCSGDQAGNMEARMNRLDRAVEAYGTMALEIQSDTGIGGAKSESARKMSSRGCGSLQLVAGRMGELERENKGGYQSWRCDAQHRGIYHSNSNGEYAIYLKPEPKTLAEPDIPEPGPLSIRARA